MTRSRLHKALQKLREEESEDVSPVAAMDARIALLERARAAAQVEQERTEHPKTALDQFESVLNSMCDPVGAPLLDEIETRLEQLRQLRRHATD